ncbi:hypothetical protein B0T16DRAFT_412408 [Cercophora newfieldiana]|uniref:DUF5672 domain-containing protein n=1 Tax=Cercophora newfieldiana TaxID=92897 RepID=A0AA39Y4X8_9PEZI|nr:hypothetical protein B0T16DRAFT_412408 [Cercophora newfieldiana]
MALFKHLEKRSTSLEGIRAAEHVYRQGRQLASAAWGRASRRMRLAGAVLMTLTIVWLSCQALGSAGVNMTLPLPSVSIEYHYQRQASKLNESKVALLIENRPLPLLAPLMLHFISVVPPDWRFRFMGSLESVAKLNQSVAIRHQVAAGKLDLTYIPANMTVGSQEEISRFLTTLWVYETLLAPAEWLLIFQTDSILCANSRRTLNDYLEYDWVGAPWKVESRFGGNGGLSLRRVSAIVEVLRNQVRRHGSEPEDIWLTDRLGHRPGARLANGTVSLVFSGEQHQGEKVHVSNSSSSHANLTAGNGAYIPALDAWRDGFYEPMGYHTGNSGKLLPSGVWGTPAQRKHIWDYCPEIKMTLQMDAAEFVPGECGAIWRKRSPLPDPGTVPGLGFVGLGVCVAKTDAEDDDRIHTTDGSALSQRGWETEMIDGEEYPVLSGLMPWL